MGIMAYYIPYYEYCRLYIINRISASFEASWGGGGGKSRISNVDLARASYL